MGVEFVGGRDSREWMLRRDTRVLSRYHRSMFTVTTLCTWSFKQDILTSAKRDFQPLFFDFFTILPTNSYLILLTTIIDTTTTLARIINYAYYQTLTEARYYCFT